MASIICSAPCTGLADATTRTGPGVVPARRSMEATPASAGARVVSDKSGVPLQLQMNRERRVGHRCSVLVHHGRVKDDDVRAVGGEGLPRVVRRQNKALRLARCAPAVRGDGRASR